MTGDPYGQALQALFIRLFLGGTRLPDLFAFVALLAGLAAAVWLPLPVRAVPSPALVTSRLGKTLQLLAALAGLALPGAWDLLAGRAGAGALQTLAFGACYAVARSVRGEGFMAQILVSGDRFGYFGDVPAGVAYLDAPVIADAATWLLVAIFAVNLPLTLRRARQSCAFRR